MLHQSIEAGCLVSVIEGEPQDTRQRLRDHMLDGELIEFRGQVGQLLDLINEEIYARRARLHQTTPAADTGSMNIIRGRE